MLKRTEGQIVGDREPTVSEFASSARALENFVGFIRRRLPIIISATLVSVMLGVAYMVSTPPSYTARATMIIDSRKVQLFQQQSVLGDIPIDSASVESQLEVLRSENVALSVIKDLRLSEDPEFSSPGGLISRLVLVPLSFLFGSDASSETEVVQRAVRAFQDRLNIKRVGLSYVIEISFRSFNAERAAEIANAVADAYIIDQLEAKYQATRRASSWLQDRINELREQASTAERAVVDFKTRNNIVTTGGAGGRLVGEQQVAELNSQLVIARAQTAEARARLERIETVLRSGSDESVDATVTDTLRSEVVSKLRSRYLELSTREAEWSARYGKQHLAAVNLRNQMREIRNAILDELRRLAETYKSDFEIAKQREEGVQKELTQAVTDSQVTNQAQIVLKELESSSQSYRVLYDTFLQRYMESVQQQSFPITEARIISKATRPNEKSHPKTLLILAISGLGGMILGLGLSTLRELSDRVFRTTKQVESILQTDCIAVVPSVPGMGTKTGVKLAREAGNLAADRSRARVLTRTPDVSWTVVDAPFSRYAEAIRAIKLAADLDRVVKSNKVVGFTSSLPNEGKSTVAMGLALLVAQTGASVVLVDCDLRNPSLTQRLTPNAELGMLEVISGKARVDEVVWSDTLTKMKFLPMVMKSRLAHTHEILNSEAMKKLFDGLRQAHDYVVVDLSPLAPIVDVRATTQLIDSYVFVIEWGVTKTDVAEETLDHSPAIRENLLGVILNKTDIASLSRYEGHLDQYYHNKHYARYGYAE